MSAENVELARCGYEAILRGDLETVGAMLAPDVKWHAGDPDWEYACHNREQALAWMRRLERAGPGRLLDVVDAGDRVVVLLEVPKDSGEGSPEASATRVRGQVTTFRDGKVVEMVGFESVEAAFEAAGLAVPPEFKSS